MNVKNKYIKFIILVRHLIFTLINKLLNKTVKGQLKNPKTIPIIIINFNQLFYLKLLIDALLKRGYSNVVIIDNNSTYKPLLDYYNDLPEGIKIHRLKTNKGHLSFWHEDQLVEKYAKGYYVVTDPDVVPVKDCSEDFLETFRKLLDKAYDRTKVGFSLKIDDIPMHNPQAQIIKDWEAQFWKSKIHPKAYKAEIDTTFALYRPNYRYKRKNFTKAWRTDFPLQAIHGGWYVNPNKLTDEQCYYMKTANASASWLLDDSGNIKETLHKNTYTNEDR
ncbi:glycosyltransferase family 2 protein [Winogradskyella sp.]|uniref:glycosyltransferase family 2 protein n=1 Tax=Winogradskyella sp. TaxID=1883156 RepID=UPI0025CE8F84|nr:glycosyltransferase family 2 protein [Winogradskyella sp.]